MDLLCLPPPLQLCRVASCASRQGLVLRTAASYDIRRLAVPKRYLMPRFSDLGARQGLAARAVSSRRVSALSTRHTTPRWHARHRGRWERPPMPRPGAATLRSSCYVMVSPTRACSPFCGPHGSRSYLLGTTR